jgi:hypothetical protein
LNAQIINAKLYDWSGHLCGQGHNASENGEPVGLDTHAIGDTDAQSAASCQANDLDQLEKSCGYTRPRGNKGGQTLRKDLSWTGWHITKKIPNSEQDAHRLPYTGQIGQLALIATMNTSGS